MNYIYKFLFTAILGVASNMQGQTTTENYIQSRTYLEPVTATSNTVKQINTVQYFDGLGRPKQIVGVKPTPMGKDVVTHIEYDTAGRQLKDYLPVPQVGTQNGNIYSTPLNNAATIYGNEKIYSEKIVENSPLDRIQQKIQIGNDWGNKPIKFDYDTNVDGEVFLFKTNTNWVDNATSSVLTLSGTFPANELYKNTVTDEDGNKTTEYKNGKGQLIMSRKYDGTINNDTYYVYNEYDQLAFVIPPKALAGPITNKVLNDLCYQYRYNGKSSLVEKKFPGKGWEYMIYDKAERLVMSQDPTLKSKNQWIITEYDALNRVAYTGLIYNSASRNDLQGYISSNPINNAQRKASYFTISGMDVYYGSSPTVNVDILLSVNYYDTYPPYSFNPSFPSTIQGEASLTGTANADGRSTKGLPVMNLVKNIEDDNWTKNYSYYDTKGRAIGSHSINHLGGYTRTESKLDFAGIPQLVITKHKRLNSDIERVITENLEYDSQNRLLIHRHKVDNNPEEILAQNTYNELFLLSNKKVGNNLQSVDYTYNIRGWLNKINDPANLSGKLFGYEIRYNNPVNTNLSASRFNGNIAEVDWKTSNDGVLKRYSYAYDGLNRLKYGHYSEPNSSIPLQDHYGESVEYDENGNITRLYRNAKNSTNGLVMQIDNLTYNYVGNKLQSVSDLSQNYGGYPIGGNPIGYDTNGNMISHMDKGISSIQYNYQNLPNNIKINKGPGVFTSTINYLYKSDGSKLKKQYIFQQPKPSGGFYISESSIEYLDGFQYSLEPIPVGHCPKCPKPSLTLKFVPTTEGYYDFTNNSYIYNYTDHLGNVRLGYKKGISEAEVIEEDNYYPFGLQHYGNNVLEGNRSYQYKYNGKELQTETGMYDYGARFYMPDLGRWGTEDPLVEFQQSMSPYAYVYNNPIRLTDPSGMLISGGGDPEYEPQIAPEALGGEKNPIQIDGIVLSAVSGTHLRNNSLSYLGINSLDSYHDSQDRLANGIRNSPAALATEKFERNLAFTMGTFMMGGSNLVGSAAWSTFDAILSYQNPKTQNTIAGIQAIALVIQLKHGNLNAARKVLQEAAQLEGKATYSVYHGLDAAGNIKYVGITKREPALRWAEHANSGTANAQLDYEVIAGATGLSKLEARVLEQTLINQHGLEKNGGALLNKINSISSKNWAELGIKP